MGSGAGDGWMILEDEAQGVKQGVDVDTRTVDAPDGVNGGRDDGSRYYGVGCGGG